MNVGNSKLITWLYLGLGLVVALFAYLGSRNATPGRARLPNASADAASTESGLPRRPPVKNLAPIPRRTAVESEEARALRRLRELLDQRTVLLQKQRAELELQTAEYETVRDEADRYLLLLTNLLAREQPDAVEQVEPNPESGPAAGPLAAGPSAAGPSAAGGPAANGPAANGPAANGPAARITDRSRAAPSSSGSAEAAPVSSASAADLGSSYVLQLELAILRLEVEQAESRIAELEATLQQRTEVVDDAVRACQAAGASSVPILVDMLQHGKVDARLWAAQTLGRLGRDARDAEGALLMATDDAVGVVRDAAREALRLLEANP